MEFSRQWFSESPMSDEHLGKLIATGEWGVCMLSSWKVCYPQHFFFKSSKVKVILYSYLILKKMNERITDS